MARTLLRSSLIRWSSLWRKSSSLASVSDQHGVWYQESLQQPEKFWGDLARERLRWMKDFDTVMNCKMEDAYFKWFEGGKLNVSGNYYYNNVNNIYSIIR